MKHLITCLIIVIFGIFTACKKDNKAKGNTNTSPAVETGREIEYRMSIDEPGFATQIDYTDKYEDTLTAIPQGSLWSNTFTTDLHPFKARMKAILKNQSNSTVNYTLTVFVNDSVVKVQNGLIFPMTEYAKIIEHTVE